jgi:hypothetical protein
MNEICNCRKCHWCLRPVGDASFGAQIVPIFPDEIRPRKRKRSWEDELYSSGGDL